MCTVWLTLILAWGDKYTGEIFELGAGAYGLSMGEAIVAIVGDATATYWNPARMRTVGRDVWLMYSSDYGMKYNGVAFVNSNATHSIGGAIYWLNIPDMVFTDTMNQVIGRADLNDYMIYLGYAVSVQGYDVGVTLKSIYRDYYVDRAYGIGMDLGVAGRYKHIRWGVVLRNVSGTYMFWDSGVRDFVPPTIDVGIGYIGRNVRFGMSGTINLEHRVSEIQMLNLDTHVGVEYVYRNLLAGRIGRTRKGITVGVGIIKPPFRVDYAFCGIDIGQIHRVSFNWTLK